MSSAINHGSDTTHATLADTTHATLADAVLASLDPEQRAVATALRGPVCVLAGAGTGKTRAITHRIAHGVHSGVYDPRSVLALTFTSRAAGEMRSRLRDLGVPAVQARTFHSAALRQLQYFWPTAVGGPLPVLVEHKARLVAEAASRLRLSVDRTAVRDLSAEVEWAKVALLTPEAYPAAVLKAGRTPPAGLDAAAMARVVQSYEDVKTDRGAMDFEDVLLLTCGILAERSDVAESVRRQYRHFTVDEYQDVSPLQQRLLDLWLGGRDDVCVVGDASQTIYSFAGATPAHLLGFPGRHPGAAVVRLVRDYRSTPQVVALANRLLDKAPAAAVRARVELVAQRPPGPEPTFIGYDDDVAEAAAVAAAVRRRLDAGTPASEVAVLFRTNGQSEPLEQALSEVGVGYQLRGGEKFFSRAEVRQAVLLLRGAARGDDGSRPLGEAVRDVLASAGWTPEPPSAAGAARDRWSSLQALAALADDVAAARAGARIPDLVTEIDERTSAQHAPTVQGVTLASFHAAKGLEWDAVWLVGVSEGLLPISFSTDDPEKVEEERRLLYVGVTRAREHLALSWGRARTPGGRASRTPSRFLDGLRPREAGESGGPGRGGERLREPVEEGAGAGTHLPHLPRGSFEPGGTQGRSLRGVPTHLRRGCLRRPPGVADRDGHRGQGACVRRLHRRDAGGDRRVGARRGGRAGAHPGGGPGQARALRRGRARRPLGQRKRQRRQQRQLRRLG